ncbi:MAG: hypothetical protein ACJAZ2_002095 [Glaciecola sp.]|jgi:uncharacterized protein (DUF427 family)
MKAIWNGQVLAESSDTNQIEGNHYFPTSSMNKEFFKTSDLTSVCHWKGTANYYDIEVNGETNKDACWYYTDPSTMASGVKDRVAFWRGVEITE